MFETSTADADHLGKSLGAVLATAREARKIPLQQAARETRIRVQRLREIEDDDISHFAHPSYARLFLVDYAKYLGVPIAQIRAILPDPGECGTEGYQYLQENPAGAAVLLVRRIRSRRRLMPTLALAAALLVCALGGLQLWITLRNINRLGSGQVARTEEVEPDSSASGLSGFAGDKEALELPQELPPPQASAVPPEADVLTPPGDQVSLFVGGAVEQTGRVQ